MYKIENDYERIFNNIVADASNYIIGSNLKSLILGLSGGLDSTVVAALARKVCDETGAELIGVSLPTRFNKQEEISNAGLVGGSFCDVTTIISLDKAVSAVARHLLDPVLASEEDLLKEEKIRRGNAIARLRMIYLYHEAHDNNGIVLSTDNLTEYFLGFWTLHGDVGDFGMIQGLWKTEVYGLAAFLRHTCLVEGDVQRAKALRRAIDAIPTDGLGISDTDLDQIEAKNYKEVDEILVAYLNGDAAKLSHPVIKRHLNSFFKRDNPHNISREEILR